MRHGYCDDCKAMRPFRRAFGWGTFFAVLITAGFWLLTLPLYPIRCGLCGSPRMGSRPSASGPPASDPPAKRMKDWSRTDWIVMGGLLGVLLIIAVVLVVRMLIETWWK